MSTRRKFALVLYVLVALASLVVGANYCLHETFMPYHADALEVRLERALGCAGHVETNSAFFLCQTLADNTASGNGFLSCNCTFSAHRKYLCNLFLKI